MTPLLLMAVLADAQTITETFGSGANAFSIEFVTIGNPGNAPDTGTYFNTATSYSAGSVAYTYHLGKHEVSRDMINKANSIGSLGIAMVDLIGGNGSNRPASGVTWYEAAKFVNWLNISTGSTAAYKINDGIFQLWLPGDSGYSANNPFRNSLAKYVIASRDEWYKGAYGKPDGSWSKYPNGSDTTPAAVANGTLLNTAVYNGQFSPADITSAGGLSAYGTMGQGGNVWEWTETAFDGVNDTAGEDRELRGGNWAQQQRFLEATFRNFDNPTKEYNSLGFRIASLPEPSSLSLLLAGGAVLMAGRRRKSD